MAEVNWQTRTSDNGVTYEFLELPSGCRIVVDVDYEGVLGKLEYPGDYPKYESFTSPQNDLTKEQARQWVLEQVLDFLNNDTDAIYRALGWLIIHLPQGFNSGLGEDGL